jgi:hypothetical protein
VKISDVRSQNDLNDLIGLATGTKIYPLKRNRLRHRYLRPRVVTRGLDAWIELENKFFTPKSVVALSVVCAPEQKIGLGLDG